MYELIQNIKITKPLTRDLFLRLLHCDLGGGLKLAVLLYLGMRTD